MTISTPPFGPISMSDIVSAFGGVGSHSMSEYYRGGLRVQNTEFNSKNNEQGGFPIPTSGTISFKQFYGRGNRGTINVLYQGGDGGTGISGGTTVNIPASSLDQGTWYRNFVILAATFSSNQLPLTGFTSTIGGAPFTNMITLIQNASSDGHKAGILWDNSIDKNAGFTITFGSDIEYAVIYEITNIRLFGGFHLVDNSSSIADSGLTFGAANPSFTLDTSTNGFAVMAGVNNFGTIGTSITGMDLNYRGYDVALLSADRLTTSTTTTYTVNATDLGVVVWSTHRW